MAYSMKIGTSFTGTYLRECASRNFSSETCLKSGPGVIPEILLPILEQMKISYQLNPVTEEYDGMCYRNGSWLPVDSRSGKLANGTFDMIADLMAFRNFEEAAYCFQRSNPIIQDLMAFFAKKYDDTVSPYFSIIFDPFDKYTWLCLIVLFCFHISYKQVVRSKWILLILSFASLLFMGLYSGFLLTKLFVPPQIYIKDTKQMLEMIKRRKIQLLVDNYFDIDQLYEYRGHPLVNDLLDSLNYNPPIEVRNHEQRYKLLMSGKYVYYDFDEMTDSHREASNCTIDTIRSATSVPKVQKYFIFYKNFKWVDEFNKGLAQYQDRTELVWKRHIKSGWPMVKEKCFDYEQSLRSTTLVPIPITSLSSAFLLLSLTLIGTTVVLLWEKLNFINGKREELDNRTQSIHKIATETSITESKANDGSEIGQKLDDANEVKRENQEAFKNFASSWNSFVEELQSDEFEKQVLLDKVQIMNTIMKDVLG